MCVSLFLNRKQGANVFHVSREAAELVLSAAVGVVCVPSLCR